VHRPDDAPHVRSGHETLDRLQTRRLDRTGRLRSEEQTLLAVAELRPQRVLDAGCDDGRYRFVARRPKCVFVAEAA
jgi:hypothetical protein